MARKPDFRTQFPRLTFPVMELTFSAWSGPRGLSNRNPTDPRWQDEVGPLRSVTLAFGELFTSGEWWTVESTLAGTCNSGGPAAERALAILGSAAWFVQELQTRYELDPVSTMPDDPWAIQDEADPKSMTLLVDEAPVEFIAASARGLSAAADLPRCTITICGMGELDRLALQTAKDPAPYPPPPGEGPPLERRIRS
jgi:hypothetical protein